MAKLIVSPIASKPVILGNPSTVVVHGNTGNNGKSAYELWLEAGNEGSLQDFLDSLKGSAGIDGIPGSPGTQGAAGNSAYQIWLEEGNFGNKSAFLASLKGASGANGSNGSNGTNGATGKSAYETWLTNGHTGSESDFLNWLRASIPLSNWQELTFEEGWNGFEGYPLRVRTYGDIVYIAGVAAPTSVESNGTVACYVPAQYRPPQDVIFFAGSALGGVLPVAAMVDIAAATGALTIRMALYEEYPEYFGPAFFNNESWFL